jgi:hypothetical protein
MGASSTPTTVAAMSTPMSNNEILADLLTDKITKAVLSTFSTYKAWLYGIVGTTIGLVFLFFVMLLVLVIYSCRRGGGYISLGRTMATKRVFNDDHM